MPNQKSDRSRGYPASARARRRECRRSALTCPRRCPLPASQGTVSPPPEYFKKVPPFQNCAACLRRYEGHIYIYSTRPRDWHVGTSALNKRSCLCDFARARCAREKELTGAKHHRTKHRQQTKETDTHHAHVFKERCKPLTWHDTNTCATRRRSTRKIHC